MKPTPRIQLRPTEDHTLCAGPGAGQWLIVALCVFYFAALVARGDESTGTALAFAKLARERGEKQSAAAARPLVAAGAVVGKAADSGRAVDPPQPPARLLKPRAIAPPVLKPKAAAVKRAAGYPLRSRWWWEGRPGHFLDDYRHLTQGEHAGKFDAAWLQTLTREELNALHADDHEGRVKWQAVVRPAVAAPRITSGCPGGICPRRLRWSRY